MAKDILVLGEVRRGNILRVTYELIGKARELADKKGINVKVLLLFDSIDKDPEYLFGFGADEIICIKNKNLFSFNQEIYINISSHVIKITVPEIVLCGATTTGRTILPAVAGKLNTGLTADCTGLDIEESSGLLLQTRPAIGGNIMATIKTPNHTPQMATVRPKNFPIPERNEKSGKIEYLNLDNKLFESKIKNISFKELSSDEKNIQDLDVIVAGGKGLKRAENFEPLHNLANLLNGGIGASRPTIEAKWMEYPHQVGLSGKVVSPKVYFAIGVSGAVQHLAGMQTSEFIIAINKDPDASIFNVCDIGFVGDLFEIVPKIILSIKNKKRL